MANRPVDIALPMIYETYDQGNMKGVTKRWIEISQVTLAVSGVVLAVAAANNTTFVNIWTNGRIHWSESAQWLIAIYFYIFLAAGIAGTSLGMNKKFGISRYSTLIQGVATVLIAIPATIYFSFTGLILTVSLLYIPGMMTVGVKYLAKLTGSSAVTLGWDGLGRPTAILPAIGFLAWAASLIIPLFPGYLGLIISSLVGTVTSFAVMLQFGVSKNVRTIIISTFSRMIRRFLPNPPLNI